jgi:serine/threonine-protein kinase
LDGKGGAPGPAAASGHARDQRAEPKGGTIIADRYQIDRLIARGGMAAVYLAHHVKLNRPVALKILSPPPDAEDPQSFEERFRLEAETLAALDHPNIVILHDFGETTDARFFLAMEYVEGPRLSDLLKDGPLPVERALQLIVQVCAALRYAHKRGVVHRDLKPSNMLVRTKDNGEEQVKVVDFGLVKLTEADQSITRAGLILGSPHCMSPEQIKGMEVDHRADIYATGILLFRTVTGQYPFHGPNSAATMIAHLNQPVPSFASMAPDLQAPPGLEEIVDRCLSKSPAERYADMASLMDDLATVMNVPPEQFRSVSQSTSTISRRHAPSSSRAPWLLAGVIGVAAVVGLLIGGIGLAVLSLMGPRDVPPPAAAVAPAPVAAQPAATTEPAATEPAPVEPAPVEPVTASGTAEPATTPAAAPPKPKVRPKVKATTAPEEPAKATEPEKPKEGEEPPGYMGLPDDFE